MPTRVGLVIGRRRISLVSNRRRGPLTHEVGHQRAATAGPAPTEDRPSGGRVNVGHRSRAARVFELMLLLMLLVLVLVLVNLGTWHLYLMVRETNRGARAHGAARRLPPPMGPPIPIEPAAAASCWLRRPYDERPPPPPLLVQMKAAAAGAARRMLLAGRLHCGQIVGGHCRLGPPMLLAAGGRHELRRALLCDGAVHSARAAQLNGNQDVQNGDYYHGHNKEHDGADHKQVLVDGILRGALGRLLECSIRDGPRLLSGGRRQPLVVTNKRERQGKTRLVAMQMIINHSRRRRRRRDRPILSGWRIENLVAGTSLVERHK